MPLEDYIQIFTDASYGNNTYTGSYIINEKYPVSILLDCNASVDAELLIAIFGIEEAIKLYPNKKLIWHSDLYSIDKILHNKKTEITIRLAKLIKLYNITVTKNANTHKQYKSCHYHARLKARKYGDKHPLVVAESRLNKLRQNEVVDNILATIDIHPNGVSEVRISQELGVGLSIVHKLATKLHNSGIIKRTINGSGVTSCDLNNWILTK